MEDKVPNSILTLCKRHEENIQEFSKRTAKLMRRRTLGSVLPDDIISGQTQPPTEPTLTPPAVSTRGNAEATFVSDISSDITLGSEITKANTTFCGTIKLVISLTTTMSVSAFAVDAIFKVEADQLFDTNANTLSGQVKVLHRGVEMSMNELVQSYMNDNKQKRQVASDITIDFTNRIQTILTILQLNFLKNNVVTTHPIKHRSTPITLLGSTGFFRDGHRLKDFGFGALVKTGKGKLSKVVVPTSDAYLKDAPHYAHIITAMATMTNAGLKV